MRTVSVEKQEHNTIYKYMNDSIISFNRQTNTTVGRSATKAIIRNGVILMLFHVVEILKSKDKTDRKVIVRLIDDILDHIRTIDGNEIVEFIFDGKDMEIKY